MPKVPQVAAACPEIYSWLYAEWFPFFLTRVPEISTGPEPAVEPVVEPAPERPIVHDSVPIFLGCENLG